MSCDFTGHTHFQGTESDDAEEMDDSPPDFAAQEYFNEMAPPPMEVAAGGVELGGANLVVHPHKVQHWKREHASLESCGNLQCGTLFMLT